MDFRDSAPCHKSVQWLHHRCYMGEHESVVSLANQLRAVAHAFHPLRTHQRY